MRPCRPTNTLCFLFLLGITATGELCPVKSEAIELVKCEPSQHWPVTAGDASRDILI